MIVLGADMHKGSHTIAAVGATSGELLGDKTIAVTASVGIATADQSELGVTALIERADAALYQAKRAGRDQVSDTPAALLAE